MSSNYCISFRLANKTVGGKTYDQRREILEDNARTEGQGWWNETTAFLLAESNLDTNAFAAKVCKGLSAADDIVFVFDPTDQSACYFGPVESVDVLRSFFPKLKKVP